MQELGRITKRAPLRGVARLGTTVCGVCASR